MKKKEFFQIEQYLKGQLTGADLQDFMNRLQTDEKLRSTVDAYKASMMVLKEMKRADLREKLQNWDEEEEKKETKSSGKPGRIFTLGKNKMPFSIAAGFLLILGMAGMLFIYVPQTASSTFAQLQTPAVLAPERSISSAEMTQLNQLENLHFNGNYEALIDAGLNLQFEDTNAEINRKLMIADAYYRLDQHSEALAFYGNILQMDEIDQWYINEAEWRSLMIQLEASPFSTELHQQLTEIAENLNHLYNAKANELIEETRTGVFRWARILGWFE